MSGARTQEVCKLVEAYLAKSNHQEQTIAHLERQVQLLKAQISTSASASSLTPYERSLISLMNALIEKLSERSGPSASASPITAPPTEISALLADLANKLRETDVPVAAPIPISNFCNFCQRPGHKIENCRKRMRAEAQEKCHYCGIPGHKEANCYDRKRDEGKPVCTPLFCNDPGHEGPKCRKWRDSANSSSEAQGTSTFNIDQKYQPTCTPFYCDVPGHKPSDCYLKHRQENEKKSQQNNADDAYSNAVPKNPNRNSVGGHCVCTYCHIPGHVIADCNKLKRKAKPYQQRPSDSSPSDNSHLSHTERPKESKRPQPNLGPRFQGQRPAFHRKTGATTGAVGGTSPHEATSKSQSEKNNEEESQFNLISAWWAGKLGTARQQRMQEEFHKELDERMSSPSKEFNESACGWLWTNSGEHESTANRHDSSQRGRASKHQFSGNNRLVPSQSSSLNQESSAESPATSEPKPAGRGRTLSSRKVPTTVVRNPGRGRGILDDVSAPPAPAVPHYTSVDRFPTRHPNGNLGAVGHGMPNLRGKSRNLPAAPIPTYGYSPRYSQRRRSLDKEEKEAHAIEIVHSDATPTVLVQELQQVKRESGGPEEKPEGNNAATVSGKKLTLMEQSTKSAPIIPKTSAHNCGISVLAIPQRNRFLNIGCRRKSRTVQQKFLSKKSKAKKVIAKQLAGEKKSSNPKDCPPSHSCQQNNSRGSPTASSGLNLESNVEDKIPSNLPKQFHQTPVKADKFVYTFKPLSASAIAQISGTVKQENPKEGLESLPKVESSKSQGIAKNGSGRGRGRSQRMTHSLSAPGGSIFPVSETPTEEVNSLCTAFASARVDIDPEKAIGDHFTQDVQPTFKCGEVVTTNDVQSSAQVHQSDKKRPESWPVSTQKRDFSCSMIGIGRGSMRN